MKLASIQTFVKEGITNPSLTEATINLNDKNVPTSQRTDCAS